MHGGATYSARMEVTQAPPLRPSLTTCISSAWCWCAEHVRRAASALPQTLLDTARHRRARAEAAKVAALQEAWRQEAAQLQVHHSTTDAAAAAVAAASRAEASARLALAAAREAERAFHVPAPHDSRAEAEEPHCTLCGQALRGAAAEVTQANLRAAVGEAVGRSEAAGAALQAAQETHADAAQTQEKIEAKMQVCSGYRGCDAAHTLSAGNPSIRQRQAMGECLFAINSVRLDATTVNGGQIVV